MARDKTQFGRKGHAGLLSEQFDTFLIVTISGTTGQLPDTEGLGFILMAHPSNSGDLFLGGDGITYTFPMEPGLNIKLQTENLNLIYADMASGDQLSAIVLDETTLDDN